MSAATEVKFEKIPYTYKDDKTNNGFSAGLHAWSINQSFYFKGVTIS